MARKKNKTLEDVKFNNSRNPIGPKSGLLEFKKKKNSGRTLDCLKEKGILEMEFEKWIQMNFLDVCDFFFLKLLWFTCMEQ